MLPNHQSIIVDIGISADEYLRWYRGEATTISVKARNGQRVAFPADALRPFVTTDGVSGAFEIIFDCNEHPFKLVSLDFYTPAPI